ncbi:hypothetical protein SO802_008172 [Lithocarpus litseifolius]|uniref:DUF4283 domain-containing protein n=1 Tax=Lithocarpus litseifolius TaxID=425828 RepID=A0AAW2DBS1_9ROSI
MGLSTFPSLALKLMHHGLPPNTPAVAVERGTTPQQRMVFAELKDLANKITTVELVSPTLMIIGNVVALSPLWSLSMKEASCEIQTCYGTLNVVGEIALYHLKLYPRLQFALEGPGCNLTSDHSISEFSIAAKFLTKRAINVEVIAQTFTPLWRARNGFKIKRFGDHSLLFTFDNERDVDRILVSEPWSFDKHLVAMQKYDGSFPLQDIKFDRTTIWVQVHGIPPKYMSLDAGVKICEVVGDVIKPSDTKMFDAGNFIRVQVSIDLSLPLCRGRLISLNNGKEMWVSFKYERLPNVCYWCGKLTHDDRDCDLWIESEGTLKSDQRAFGPYLQASPFVATRKNVLHVPGYYAEKKKTNSTEATDRTSGQPPQTDRVTVPEHSPEEEERYTQPFTIPLMRNVPDAIMASSKPGTSSVIPANPVTVGEVLKLVNLAPAFNANDEETRKFEKVVSVEEFGNNLTAREDFNVSSEQLTKSRAPNVMGRVFSLNEGKRILPGGCKNQESPLLLFRIRGRNSQARKELLKELQRNLVCLPNVSMHRKPMITQISYWRRLIISPAKSNELPSVELSWAWEPVYRKRARTTCTGKRSLCCVFSRNTNRRCKARISSKQY